MKLAHVCKFGFQYKLRSSLKRTFLQWCESLCVRLFSESAQPWVAFLHKHPSIRIDTIVTYFKWEKKDEEEEISLAKGVCDLYLGFCRRLAVAVRIIRIPGVRPDIIRIGFCKGDDNGGRESSAGIDDNGALFKHPQLCSMKKRELIYYIRCAARRGIPKSRQPLQIVF